MVMIPTQVDARLSPRGKPIAATQNDARASTAGVIRGDEWSQRHVVTSRMSAGKAMKSHAELPVASEQWLASSCTTQNNWGYMHQCER